MAGTDGNGKLDIAKISEEDIISIGSYAWVKADVEEKIFAINFSDCNFIHFFFIK